MPIIILDEEEELSSTSPAVTQNVFPNTVAGCNDAIALIEKYRANLLPE